MTEYESDPAPGPLSPDDLRKLRELVAAIRQHKGPWGEAQGGDQLGPGVYSMPWVDTDKLAYEAMDWLYDSNRVFWFDWPEWDEGRRIFREWNDATAASLDHLTVRKLITVISRNDRFNEGAWEDFFKHGQAQQLFARLLELEEDLAAGMERQTR